MRAPKIKASRLLAVAIALLLLAAAVAARPWLRHHQQMVAVKTIQELGGRCYFARARWLGWGSRWFNQALVDNLGLDDRARLPYRIELTKTKFGDQHAELLLLFPKLHTLNLGTCAITNETVKTVARLSNLRQLDLNDTTIDDAGVKELRPLGRLQRLNLAGCAVSDRAMGHLRDLNMLSVLNLERTAVGDSGLLSLRELPELRVLSVGGTTVTAAGLQGFSRHRPLVDIETKLGPKDKHRIDP